MAPTGNAKSTENVGEWQKQIAEYYDTSVLVWEKIRIEHFQPGFYDVGVNDDKDLDHNAARLRTIEEALYFAGISDGPNPKTVLDVGCGIGGSSRYLAKKYGATVTGITLSSVEVKTANALTAEQGLADRVNFQVANAIDQPFPDGQFDLVWSIGCAEHIPIPDKEKFMRELVTVTAPGGFIILVAFCHRDLLPGEVSLQPSEQELLDNTCEAYHLARWCSAADYMKLAQALPLQDLELLTGQKI